MSQPTALTAKYASPTNEAFAIDTPLPSASGSDKTKYLAALRTAVVEAQATINKELTARMEEDNKARDASAGAAAVDDAKEEENYGEEVQEEEG